MAHDTYAGSIPGKRAKYTLRRWERDKFIAAADFTCAYCGRRHHGRNANRDLVDPDGQSWQLDHVIPVSRDGSWALENNALSCARCNRLKSNRLPDDEFTEHLLTTRAVIDAILSNRENWPVGAIDEEATA